LSGPAARAQILVLIALCNFSSGLVIKFTFKALQWYQVQAKFESSCGGDDFNISPGKQTGKLLESEL
jgi:hypothetical protein